MDRIPPTDTENYSYLQSVWENNNMHRFSDCLKWYNKKYVFPTLEAMQKKIEFYHNKGTLLVKTENFENNPMNSDKSFHTVR